MVLAFARHNLPAPYTLVCELPRAGLAHRIAENGRRLTALAGEAGAGVNYLQPVHAAPGSFTKATSRIGKLLQSEARSKNMRKIFIVATLGASTLGAPAFAEQAYPAPRYANQSGRGDQDIERQIQRLSDQINAEDRSGHLSPEAADMLVRELRDVETQLLDIRSRTLRGSENLNVPGRAPDKYSDPGNEPYQRGDDPNSDRPDDNQAPAEGSARHF
jgi:hypothetical protein